MRYKIILIFFLSFSIFACAQKKGLIITPYDKTKYERQEVKKKGSEQYPETSKPSKSQNTVIYCIFALSGKYKTIGEKALKGIELAMHKFNSSSDSFSVDIIIKDTASDPNTAGIIVRDIAKSDIKIDAIIGPVIDAPIPAIEAQDIRIPILTLSQKDQITQIGNYVFRNFLTPKAQIKAILDYSLNVMDIKNFAILYPDEKYGRLFMNLFWDELIASHRGKITGIESYKTSDTDFAEPIKKLTGEFYTQKEIKTEEEKNKENDLVEENSQLDENYLTIKETDLNQTTQEEDLKKYVTELNKEKEEKIEDVNVTDETDKIQEQKKEPEINVPSLDFQAIFIPDSSEKAALILPQLAFNDAVVPYIFGTNLWHSEELIKLAGEYAENAIIPDIIFENSNIPQSIEFNKTFKSVFNETPGIIEAAAYDNAMILFEAAKRAKENSSSIKDELLKTNYAGVTGNTSFDESGDARKKLYLLQIRNRKFNEIVY